MVSGDTLALGACTLTSGSIVANVQYGTPFAPAATTTGWIRVALPGTVTVAPGETIGILPSPIVNTSSLLVVPNGNPYGSTTWSSSIPFIRFTCGGIVTVAGTGEVTNGDTLSVTATSYTTTLGFEWEFV